MCDQRQVISKSFLFASASSSVNGTTGFASLTPSSLPGACAHLCQVSGSTLEQVLTACAPSSSPKPQITCRWCCPGAFPSCPMRTQTQPPPLMTPCCLLLREGRGLAQPGCGFFFHCVRPQGPDPCPAVARAPRATLIPCLSQPQTPCAPRFGDPGASCQRVSWRWEPCPWLGRSPLPRPPFIELCFSSAGDGADPGGVVVGFPGPGPPGYAFS